MYIKRSPLWPDPRVKPPFGAAEIDRAHPLAPDMMAYLCNEGAGPLHNLCKGGEATTPTGGATWTSALVGPVKTYDGSTQYDTITNRWRGASDYAIVVRARRASGFVLVSLDETNAEARFQYDPGGEGKLALRGHPATNIITGATALGTTAFHHLVGTRLAATLYVYVDGASDATPVADGVVPSVTSVHRIGQTVGVQFGGFSLDHLFVYGRGLSAGQARWLATEPYAFLRPIVRRRYFIPVAETIHVPRATMILDSRHRAASY
jgi:hypothetical protein